MSRSYWRGPLAVEVRNGAVVSQELGSWTSVIGVNDERESIVHMDGGGIIEWSR